MPKYKKARPKVRGKKNVVDEWETMDIDRDEQERGLKRRAKRWKEIETENLIKKAAEEVALKHADKMKHVRQPRNAIEEAWLKYDYVLANIMEIHAHRFLDNIRKRDVKLYNLDEKYFLPNPDV